MYNVSMRTDHISVRKFELNKRRVEYQSFKAIYEVKPLANRHHSHVTAATMREGGLSFVLNESVLFVPISSFK